MDLLTTSRFNRCHCTSEYCRGHHPRSTACITAICPRPTLQFFFTAPEELARPPVGLEFKDLVHQVWRGGLSGFGGGVRSEWWPGLAARVARGNCSICGLLLPPTARVVEHSSSICGLVRLAASPRRTQLNS